MIGKINLEKLEVQANKICEVSGGKPFQSPDGIVIFRKPFQSPDGIVIFRKPFQSPDGIQ